MLRSIPVGDINAAKEVWNRHRECFRRGKQLTRCKHDETCGDMTGVRRAACLTFSYQWRQAGVKLASSRRFLVVGSNPPPGTFDGGAWVSRGVGIRRRCCCCCCLYLFWNPQKVEARCPGYTTQLSGLFLSRRVR